MYKVGDKFIIEIDSIIEGKGLPLYGIRGFRSLVFDDSGLAKLERPSDIEAVLTEDGILIKKKRALITPSCRACKHEHIMNTSYPCTKCYKYSMFTPKDDKNDD